MEEAPAQKTKITVEALVKAPITTVWQSWTNPTHITKWCQASDDWHAPHAENDVKVNGKFKTTMAAKDGSVSFDFEGIYTDIKKHELIKYTMTDGREVTIAFAKQGDQIKVTETFEAEDINPIEMQRDGWQAILNNFKGYTETL